MERARVNFYQDNRDYTPGKPANITSVKTITKTWRFRPRSIWPFVMWGLVFFVSIKITIIPLVEGVYNYVASTSELIQLKSQYRVMQKQLGDMRKKRDYLKTPSYVIERAHEIGLVKPEESQMVIMDNSANESDSTKKNSTRKQ